MESKTENKELEQAKKIKKSSLDIDIFKKQFETMVIDGERSIEDAQSVQSQVKAVKSQVNAATKLEWERKKTAYEEYRDKSKTKLEELKKEYHEIRDKRKSLMDACADIYSGITKKIEDYRAECVRKAEEEKKAKELAERKKQEEDEKKLLEAEKAKKVKESEVKKPIQEITPTDPGHSEPIETTAINTPQTTQKTEEGQNGAVTDEIDIEVYNVKKLLGAIIRGERGAKTDFVIVDRDVIIEFAKKLNCRPGDEIVSGCRLIPFDHGDFIS